MDLATIYSPASGDDTYVFANSAGTDTVVEIANDGTDTYDFSPAMAGVTFNVNTGNLIVSGSGTSVTHNAKNIENLIGSQGRG